MKKTTELSNSVNYSLSQMVTANTELKKELIAANVSFEKKAAQLKQAGLDLNQALLALERTTNELSALKRKTDIYKGVLVLIGSASILAAFAILSINQL